MVIHTREIDVGHGYLISMGDQVTVAPGATLLARDASTKEALGYARVVSRSIPANSVAVGNPARVIGTYDDYIEKNRRLMETAPVYPTYWQHKSAEEKARMQQELFDGRIGFDR